MRTREEVIAEINQEPFQSKLIAEMLLDIREQIVILTQHFIDLTSKINQEIDKEND